MRCPGIADPVIHGQASAVLEPTPHVSGLSGVKPCEVGLSCEAFVVFCIRGELRLATNRHASMATNWFGGRNAVRAMNSYRQGGPVFRLTHQGSVPLTPSDPIVYAKDLATRCTPSTPNGRHIKVTKYS